MNKVFKKFTLSGVLAIFFLLISYNNTFADMASLLKKAGEPIFYTTEDRQLEVPAQIGVIISYVLSFLGVIFIVLTIYAGFLWMTSIGESEKVATAKEIFKSSLIGLIIILSANFITNFIIEQI